MGTITVGLGSGGATSVGTQYREWTDGTCDWRAGVRNCQFVIDRTLTATGFDGIENTDWKNEFKAGPAS